VSPLIAALPDETVPPAKPGGGGVFDFGGMLPLVLLFVVFYLFLIRPASKREKQRRKMLESLTKHDKVVTTGGIVGKVTSIDGDTVTLEVAPDVRIKFVRSAIQSIDRPVEPKATEAEAKRAEAKS
jgi:preprotein translocase subunit YajC